MYLFAHLALPAIVALLVAATGVPEELSLAWLQSKAETLPSLYILFALPDWVWAGICWFLYLSGAPVFMAIGAMTGRFIASRNPAQPT